MDVMGTQSQRL